MGVYLCDESNYAPTTTVDVHAVCQLVMQP